jgi:hypothetical protein
MHNLLYALGALLIALLAACQPNAAETAQPNQNVVMWTRDADTVIFRADIVGGESDFAARGRVPNCTIYGDNRVVYTNELATQQVQVIEDRASEANIAQFIQNLAFADLIYSYGAGLPTFDAEQSGDSVRPVVEELYVYVNALEHTADSLGGWEPGIFARALERCKSLSGTPVLVLPTAGWISAREVPATNIPPLTLWTPTDPPLRQIAERNGERVWYTGDLVTWLWDTLRRVPSNTLFYENERYFEVALEVPRITREAPPAP